MSKKLNRAAVARRERKEIQQQISSHESFLDKLEAGFDVVSPFEQQSAARHARDQIKSLKLKLKKLGGKVVKKLSGKGGGGMYSPSKPLKDQSLLSMAKKRQM